MANMSRGRWLSDFEESQGGDDENSAQRALHVPFDSRSRSTRTRAALVSPSLQSLEYS